MPSRHTAVAEPVVSRNYFQKLIREAIEISENEHIFYSVA
jgi:hypothetical protein